MPAGTTFLIKEGMVSDVINNYESSREPGVCYYYLTIRNQFIHAVHPIGWIRKLILKVNGEDINPENMFFVVRGQWVSVKNMPTITDIYWSIGEEANLYVKCDKPLEIGNVDVEITFIASTIEETRSIDIRDVWPKRSATISLTATVR